LGICQKGYTTVSDLKKIKFGLGEGVPGQHPHTKFHRSGLKNVGLQPQKSRKIIAILGINLPCEIFFGVYRKS